MSLFQSPSNAHGDDTQHKKLPCHYILPIATSSALPSQDMRCTRSTCMVPGPAKKNKKSKQGSPSPSMRCSALRCTLYILYSISLETVGPRSSTLHVCTYTHSTCANLQPPKHDTQASNIIITISAISTPQPHILSTRTSRSHPPPATPTLNTPPQASHRTSLALSLCARANPFTAQTPHAHHRQTPIPSLYTILYPYPV